MAIYDQSTTVPNNRLRKSGENQRKFYSSASVQKIYQYDFDNTWKERIPPLANTLLFVDLTKPDQREIFLVNHLEQICEYFDSCELIIKVPGQDATLIHLERCHSKVFVAEWWEQVSFFYYLIKIG
ncbi:MAG: hypothetical protein HC880_13120 [Bacteroidia bacterium]|nr:hypothetical protein [Bacteroidia bacterium]